MKAGKKKMKTPSNHNGMKGQALVLIAVALVGLLGVVAMAVDGSMIYSDRRELQSAADNAAMSAAATAAGRMDTHALNYQSFTCGSAGVQDAMVHALNKAIDSVALYGYSVDTDISDHNGVQISCHIDVNAGLVERYLDVRVEIVHQSNTGFTRFILPNGVSNTVEAVARIHPRRSLSMGNAIAALSPNCDPGIDVGGNGSVNVMGGGIFSNSCMAFTGATDITVNVDYGGIGYVTSYTEKGNVDLQPPGLTPEQSTELLPYVEIPTPDCLSLPDYGVVNVDGVLTINPGRYDGITLDGGDHLIMNPGLYCLYGDFQTNGHQTVEVNPSSSGDEGVTIYMASGTLLFNGNSLIILRAPAISQPPAIKGMLVYMPPSNTGTITLTGTSGSSFRGTVYSPYGDIIVGGTADIPFATELVGANVTVSGNAAIDITDDAYVNYTRPPLMELVK
ncbi:MAG: Tad domain-containing protein [Anaerolineaceae bacterium]|nr:Tad domain-containing protein [Anaerolineaceae bacterium]